MHSGGMILLLYYAYYTVSRYNNGKQCTVALFLHGLSSLVLLVRYLSSYHYNNIICIFNMS